MGTVTLTNQVNSMTDESIDEQVARIRPLMNNVDLSKSMSKNLISAYHKASSNGEPTPRWVLKLLVLMENGEITDEEYRDVGMYFAKHPDKIGAP